MSSRGKRDDVIERLLRALHVDSSASGGADCLDAETLARWADGTLSGEARGAVLAHAVGCARCRALLAAMVRTEPPRIAPASRRFPAMLVRWALPLAAAAALALWIAVDREAPPARAPERVAQAPASVALQTPASPATPAAELEAPRSTSSASADAPAERDVRAESRTRVTAADAPPRGDARDQSRLELQDTPAAAPPAQSAVPAPAETVIAPTAAEPSQVQRQAAPNIAPETAKQIPTSPQAATEQIPGGGLAETVAQDPAAARGVVARRFRSQATWVEVPSPEPLVRWRFTPGGDVERSADAGLTWTREGIGGARVQLIVGVAPSSSVCWLGGRDGLVLRFTSAQGWHRVPLPVRAAVISIAASDAQNAIVRVQGGQFSTTDGGKTWH